MSSWQDLSMIIGVVTMAIILGMAIIVFYQILTDKIRLQGLIEEPGSDKASLSRFQFLIFTFVVAGVFLLLSIESGTFVDIPESVLGLLGISGGSYVLAKGIQSGADKAKAEAEAKVAAAAPAAPAVQSAPPVPPVE